jgi:hypothetical protein
MYSIARDLPSMTENDLITKACVLCCNSSFEQQMWSHMAQWCPQVTWTAIQQTMEYTKVEHTCKICGVAGMAYLDNSTNRAVELSMLELRPTGSDLELIKN